MLTSLLDNNFTRLDTRLYRQIVRVPVGTYYAPLVADLFLFCYEKEFMMSLSNDIIDAFNATPSYLDDILEINNLYFENMVSQKYHSA